MSQGHLTFVRDSSLRQVRLGYAQNDKPLLTPEWLRNKKLDTYNFKTFNDLKVFYKLLYSSKVYERDGLIDLNQLPKSINAFLATIDFDDNLHRIQNNSGSKATFYDNFHRWFDGFKVLKYVHFARDNY